MSELDKLICNWQSFKKMEAEAADERRLIEDQITKLIELQETFEGTKNIDTDLSFYMKVTGRMNRKVDSNLVQEIAAEEGFLDYIGDLFRWKAEVNVAIWKATEPRITQLLSQAITVSPGRPSFSIVDKGI
jgi:hypothetical protein